MFSNNRTKLVLGSIGILILVIAFYLFLEKNLYWHLKVLINPDQLPIIDKDKSFSFIVLPDTQIYSKEYPDIFCNQTNWIVEMKKRLNIIYVSHLGDIVDDSSQKNQWTVAKKCMSILDGKVPYGIVPGNHDIDSVNIKSTGFSKFDSYFPTSLYANTGWYVDHYMNNQNSAILVNGTKTQILFINLEIEPSNESLAWAKTVLARYPNIFTIVTTHKYLPDDSIARDNTITFSDGKTNNTGEQIWQKLVKNNCQIRMVINGHYHETDGENKLMSRNSCGQNVIQILQDYQMRENGGNGLLRIFTMTPSKHQIDISTYSPLTKQFEEDESSKFIFSY